MGPEPAVAADMLVVFQLKVIPSTHNGHQSRFQCDEWNGDESALNPNAVVCAVTFTFAVIDPESPTTSATPRF